MQRAQAAPRNLAPRHLARAAALAVVVGVLASLSPAEPAFATEGTSVVRAGSPQMQDRSGYNSRYIFSMTKAVADAPWSTAVKPPVMLFTIPVDLILLPITLIAGFF